MDEAVGRQRQPAGADAAERQSASVVLRREPPAGYGRSEAVNADGFYGWSGTLGLSRAYEHDRRQQCKANVALHQHPMTVALITAYSPAGYGVSPRAACQRMRFRVFQ